MLATPKLLQNECEITLTPTPDVQVQQSNLIQT